MSQRLSQKTRVLFMCLRNDARSPIAEAWLNYLHGDQFEARSAGLEPWPLNPMAVTVMQEVDIDISGQIPRRVFDFVQSGDLFSYAITLWDQTIHEHRAYFPGFIIRLQWNFPDPVLISGNPNQRLDNFREMRDHLKDKIEIWIDQIKSEKVICLRKAS